MRILVLCKDVVSDADTMNVIPWFLSCMSFALSVSLSMAYTTWISPTAVADCGVVDSPWEEGPSALTQATT